MSNNSRENEVSRHSREMTIHAQRDNVDWGKPAKVVTRKTSIRSTATGKLDGSLTIATKESAPPSFKDYLISEAKDDFTSLPDSVVKEIQGNIRKGAKDLDQKWKNALELVNTAYHVASVKRPGRSQQGAWEQYESLISFAVRQLSATRGLNGGWRTTDLMIREAAPSKYPKRRFFVDIPGERAQEVDGETLDEVIDAISNRITRSREVIGTRVRVTQRDETSATVSVYVRDQYREKIRIREVS